MYTLVIGLFFAVSFSWGHIGNYNLGNSLCIALRELFKRGRCEASLYVIFFFLG